MEKPTRLKVYDIFIDYFGEENVDLQSLQNCWDIIVRFPKVTVTNENNNQIDIYDLFAIVTLTPDGRYYKMRFTRTTFTTKQFYAGYIHSHIIPFQTFDDLTVYRNFCYGDGPIGDTIISVSRYNFDINKESYLWELFCVELSKYVKVESLSGGPYRTMSSVNDSGILQCKLQNILEINNISYHTDKYNHFIHTYLVPYIIKYKKLDIIYANNYYSLNYSTTKAIEIFTDYFKDFINLLYQKKIKGIRIEESVDDDDNDISIFVNRECYYELSLDTFMCIMYYSGGEYYLFKENHFSRDINDFKDKTIIKFRNKEYKFNILDDTTENITSNIMLKAECVIKIINYINIILNKNARN